MSLRKLALVQCWYLLAVIIYGALVRATLSGAGCGAHWPLCNGQVLPEITQLATAIEFIHRLSSGLCLPLALLVLFVAIKQRRLFSTAYGFAWGTLGFVVIEALIGASLVLLEHVAYNRSQYRAVSISIHLLSSNFLLACALLTWNFSKKSHLFTLRSPVPLRYLLTSAGLILATNFSGAFTVLADTLFPSASLANSFAESVNSASHLFVRMRIFHPFFAMAAACGVLFLRAKAVRFHQEGERFRQYILGLYLGQGLLGLSNILWPAALLLQLAHLLGAELIWLSFIMLWGHSIVNAETPTASGTQSRVPAKS